jgi:TRAP-type C4-dicarboxylate transport system permease small subunit
MVNRVGHGLLESVKHFLEAVTMVGFIGMLLSTGGQVLFRYVLQISVPWTEELARILFIQTMFFGIAIAIRENEHIIVDFLFKKMNIRSQAVGQIIYNGAILIFLCFLARGTLAMAKMNWGSFMIALDWIRTGHLYLGEFIAILCMILYIIIKIYENLTILRTGDPL